MLSCLYPIAITSWGCNGFSFIFLAYLVEAYCFSLDNVHFLCLLSWSFDGCPSQFPSVLNIFIGSFRFISSLLYPVLLYSWTVSMVSMFSGLWICLAKGKGEDIVYEECFSSVAFLCSFQGCLHQDTWSFPHSSVS